jgi:translation initiation factor 2 subunit 3
MPADEKLRKDHEESDSEEEEEVEIQVVPKVDIDVSKLTPLSPEVISKQVSADRSRISRSFLSTVLRLP